ASLHRGMRSRPGLGGVPGISCRRWGVPRAPACVRPWTTHLAGETSLVVELGADAELGQGGATLLDAGRAGDRARERQRIRWGRERIEDERQGAHGPELHPAAAAAGARLSRLPPRAPDDLQAGLGWDRGRRRLELVGDLGGGPP